MNMPTMEQQTIAQEIRQFVIANFLFGEDNGSLKADESFLENGIIDSTGVLELVAFLEQTYHINVRDNELVPDNLDSLDKVAAFVHRKQNA
jgi:acyl carrier protein